MNSIHIRPIEDTDREWVAQFIRVQWGSNRMALHGTLYFPHTLPGFIALHEDENAGLITYHITDDVCEIITLNSLVPDQGVGTQLIEAVRNTARRKGCKRLCVTTTNDNLNALRFYQKGGFRLAAIHPGAVERARAIKPEIPLVGEHGIPIRDEIELEIALN